MYPQFTKAVFTAYDKECSHIFEGNPSKKEITSTLQVMCDSFVLKDLIFFEAEKTGVETIHYHNPTITKKDQVTIDKLQTNDKSNFYSY